ncbi:MAG: Crp/Fnr family transcriptional regulator [Candidatus Magnetoovum sp. WYHC-5]|nr:Crp/Fnr family transcriptional regulator [Candidatus Magnetoovum sp. WYHC-5]
MNLENVSIFNNLESATIEKIAKCFKEIDFKKKQTIFNEGDPSEWLYIVKSGIVKITKNSNEGKEFIIEIIKEGELFGAVAVLNSIPYPANAISMENTTLLRISRTNLLELVAKIPTIMFNFASILGDRVLNFHDTLKHIALEKVEARIASVLIKFANQNVINGLNCNMVEIRLTKQDIADMVGTTVETTIRTISRFKRLGFIEYKDGKIVITNIKALTNYGKQNDCRHI